MTALSLSKEDILHYFYEENLRPYLTFHKSTQVKTLLGESIAIELARRLPRKKKRVRILDIGCGGGELTRTFLESLAQHRPNLKIYLLATDRSGEVLDHACKNLLNLPSDVKVDLRQVGINSNSQGVHRLCNVVGSDRFDLLIASFVLHWIDKCDDAIDQLFECLAPCGSICIAEISLKNGDQYAEFRRRLFKIAYEKEKGPYQQFFAEDFEAILKKKRLQYNTVSLQTVIDLKAKHSEEIDESMEFLTALPRRNWKDKQRDAIRELTGKLAESSTITCGYKMIWVRK